ncbi:hypothetical protein SH597_04735 [Lacticaseibacillus paracasei]|uniref:Uncharacterized protein n=1 Tax=Lacticaseibacillus paracasei TaxID=1597 RepID=A0ABD7BRG4_LACPA|nr:hypothetical protein [Lacticaseibacillus paracasei]QOP54939.1 hypothetical protein HCJ88_03750 [Lacticaseibacillus paracasei]QPB56504.1 hypothetical protein GFB64_05055 [Lacticaseibacillus paracasei]WPQ31564.1 hypothetical protein SH597_04735 [Lacticaseibacillus paracasei]
MLDGLNALLKTTKLPVVYGAWGVGHAPPLPYLVVMEQYRDDLYADDQHFYCVHNYDVELYFDRKDPRVEQSIEDLFATHDIVFEVAADQYLSNERMYQRIYSIELDKAQPLKEENLNA